MTSPGESTCDTAVGDLKRVGPDAAFAHLTPSSVIIPVCRSLLTAPPSSLPGWKAIRADWSLVSSTTAIRQGEISDSDLTSASLTPQSPDISSLLIAPRQPCASSDRKSTRLTSSPVEISYAVFCLKKKSLGIAHFAAVPLLSDCHSDILPAPRE